MCLSYYQFAKPFVATHYNRPTDERLDYGRHLLLVLTHYHAIKEDTIVHFADCRYLYPYVVVAQKNRLNETVLLSIQNKCYKW